MFTISFLFVARYWKDIYIYIYIYIYISDPIYASAADIYIPNSVEKLHQSMAILAESSILLQRISIMIQAGQCRHRVLASLKSVVETYIDIQVVVTFLDVTLNVAHLTRRQSTTNMGYILCMYIYIYWIVLSIVCWPNNAFLFKHTSSIE